MRELSKGPRFALIFILLLALNATPTGRADPPGYSIPSAEAFVDPIRGYADSAPQHTFALSRGAFENGSAALNRLQTLTLPTQSLVNITNVAGTYASSQGEATSVLAKSLLMASLDAFGTKTNETYDNIGYAESLARLGRDPSGNWRERLILSTSVNQDPVGIWTPPANASVASIRVAPDPEDPNHTQVKAQVLGRELPVIGVFTGGLVNVTQEVDLIHVSPLFLGTPGLVAELSLHFVYDASVLMCLSKIDDQCTLYGPDPDRADAASRPAAGRIVATTSVRPESESPLADRAQVAVVEVPTTGLLIHRTDNDQETSSAGSGSDQGHAGGQLVPGLASHCDGSYCRASVSTVFFGPNSTRVEIDFWPSAGPEANETNRLEVALLRDGEVLPESVRLLSGAGSESWFLPSSGDDPGDVQLRLSYRHGTPTNWEARWS